MPDDVKFLKDYWERELSDSIKWLREHPEDCQARRDNFKALHALEILGVQYRA